MTHRIAACVLVLCTGLFAQEPIVASDLLKLKTVSGITISPDGTRVAYVVSSIVPDPDDEGEWTGRRHIWIAPVDGSGPPKQLTFGDRRDGSPVFSPDGTTLAFTRSHEKKSQIWTLPLAGGEARPITKGDGASGARWSPDGTKMLFSRSVEVDDVEGPPPWAEDRPGRGTSRANGAEPSPDGGLDEVRAWLAKNADDANPKVITRRNFQGERTLRGKETYNHLYLLDVATGEETRLTTGHQSFGDARWSPDGTMIVCTSIELHGHPDEHRERDIWALDLDDPEPYVLIPSEGWRLGGARFSPDGSRLVIGASDTEDGYSQREIHVWSRETKRRTSLTDDFDRSAGGARWSDDGRAIFFTASSTGGRPLYRMNADGSGFVDVVAAAEDTGIGGFDVTGDRVVYAATRVANPMELYVADIGGEDETRLTALHAGWIAKKKVVQPQEKWITGPDGHPIQTWVMEPARRKAGEKYPLVLEIHGGPSSMWGPGERSMWHEFQLLCARGYGVVYSNPRGSGGYGYDFKRANYRDWGTGPASDVLAALDEAAKLDWVDRDRLFVTGGSYAGYLTAWIVSQDHRFKAAVAQRGVYELSTFFGEGNAWRLVPNHFGGYPWEPEARKYLDANSPQTFVKDIRTPLLIMHADQDLRTGVIQSELLYRSLKVLGRPVEYVRYPKEGHELSRSGDPRRRMDRLLRIVEFFERYAASP